MLALYVNHLFLPPEVVEILRTLQDDSPPLTWSALQPVLVRELGTARLNELRTSAGTISRCLVGASASRLAGG
ncbi:MAG: hypothetical protein R3F37_16880 [Candidatus Competibacteraceae bacterium]